MPGIRSLVRGTLTPCVRQALVEGLLKEYPNTLVLRVRMPIVQDLTYPRNFITKIIKYDNVRSNARPAPCRQ